MVDRSIREPQAEGLTEAERQVLDMLTEEGLTRKEIAQRRGCKRQAVHKLIKKLQLKGYINSGGFKVDKNEALPSVNPSDVRLHGQEFHIIILNTSEKYQRLLKKSNYMNLDGSVVKLFRSAIEIYAGPGISFYGKDEHEADRKSVEYWKRFIVRLEHELQVVLWKERMRNIREVNHHYARGNSEIAENAKEHKEHIRVFAEEDGKLAYWTDGSFGADEDETGHPETAKQDRKRIDKQVNDWRLRNPRTNSEIDDDLVKALDELKLCKEMSLQSTDVLKHYGMNIVDMTKRLIYLEKRLNEREGH